MAGSEGRQSITQLQETITTLRQELNDATNGGDATRAELRTIQGQLKATQDELAAAKLTARPAPAKGTTDDGKQERQAERPAFGWRARR